MTTTQVAKSFITTQLYFETEPGVEATWDDLPVPGIGPDKGQPGLNKFGITNAAQIVGYFLQAAKGDEKVMADFLISHGCSAQHVKNSTVPSLRIKCEGFVSETVDDSAPPQHVPAGTTAVYANFMSKQMSWADDWESLRVPGIGDVGKAKLASYNICNALGLIGMFMVYNGSEDEIVKLLLGCGIRQQDLERNQTIEAIRAKTMTFMLHCQSSNGSAATSAAVTATRSEDATVAAAETSGSSSTMVYAAILALLIIVMALKFF
jgi:hypothetical protein